MAPREKRIPVAIERAPIVMAAFESTIPCLELQSLVEMMMQGCTYREVGISADAGSTESVPVHRLGAHSSDEGDDRSRSHGEGSVDLEDEDVSARAVESESRSSRELRSDNRVVSTVRVQRGIMGTDSDSVVPVVQSRSDGETSDLSTSEVGHVRVLLRLELSECVVEVHGGIVEALRGRVVVVGCVEPERT